MQNQQFGSDAKGYKEQAQQRKQLKIEKLWNEIEKNPELRPQFILLKKKIKNSHTKREETSGMILSMKEEYSQLKADIKEFLKKQNKIKSVNNPANNK
ncbi:unnamed protein product (macronuclear) [Paramecium tetraurelia]|uniref:Uncharacterized protein n=1 Tax=Paramecium tetraurelia TaxID=5888 RepID=A0CY47_PARTE|nr:uncharacterized protein GSPATT00011346001 [Paramecium tetraurelia]CAK75714.1 unnamed protein product [Paramecium tetraurelia]|eukprot:XP_001443111.1 hypothetical protein (macronuclear) [Paramecium tetraurelia strain d4-2]